jgi:transposase
MPAARFVRPLSEHEQFALHQQYRTTHDADLRSRTQMILLSAAGQPVAQIASLTLFGEDTVLYWLDRYEQDGIDGLADRPRSGRPPKSR